jgi:hypothetical protein
VTTASLASRAATCARYSSMMTGKLKIVILDNVYTRGIHIYVDKDLMRARIPSRTN